MARAEDAERKAMDRAEAPLVDDLRDNVRAALRSGEVGEWSLAVIRAGREERWGLHIAAARVVISELAARIDGPWRLHVRAKRACLHRPVTWANG